MTTAIRLQTTLTPQPVATHVDGQITVAIGIQIVDDVPPVLDFDYVLLDASSAVYFASGGKIRREAVVVTWGQMNVSHTLPLVCGPGSQAARQADIVLTISGSGVPLAPPASCRFGIQSFSCAPTIPAVTGAAALMAAFLAQPLGQSASPTRDMQTANSPVSVHLVDDVEHDAARKAPQASRSRKKSEKSDREGRSKRL